MWLMIGGFKFLSQDSSNSTCACACIGSALNNLQCLSVVYNLLMKSSSICDPGENGKAQIKGS